MRATSSPLQSRALTRGWSTTGRSRLNCLMITLTNGWVRWLRPVLLVVAALAGGAWWFLSRNPGWNPFARPRTRSTAHRHQHFDAVGLTANPPPPPYREQRSPCPRWQRRSLPLTSCRCPHRRSRVLTHAHTPAVRNAGIRGEHHAGGAGHPTRSLAARHGGWRHRRGRLPRSQRHVLVLGSQ